MGRGWIKIERKKKTKLYWGKRKIMCRDPKGASTFQECNLGSRERGDWPIIRVFEMHITEGQGLKV